MRSRLFAVAALGASLSACGQPQVPPAQNYGSIAGRAYDTASNQPVAGVVVTVDTILIATTGADGTYKIANVPLGAYQLQASAPQGYTVGSLPYAGGSITAGETIPIDIPLTKQ
jgi:hypothetical protein